MARIKSPKQSRKYSELNQRIARYTLAIEGIYKSLNLEASKIAIDTEHDGEERPFRWADYPQTKKRISSLQQQFCDEIEAVIYRGTSEEWKNSNEVQDLLSNAVLKAYNAQVDKKKYKVLYQTNSDALKAFQQRREKGMNLSDRIWNQSEDYLKSLEDTISCAIEKGMSAVTLSKRVSKYLADFPSMRKDYKERFGTATDAHDCEYRSIRLAASEINMAYRTAENLRWQQMDFVVGYEIKLSGNHNCKGVPNGQFYDVCDELAGKYPKDFQWLGWHPLCRCYKIPILKTEEEFWAWDGRSEVSSDSVNSVKDVPESFKAWIKSNEERIRKAQERGTQPYFVRDNVSAINNILHPKPKELTTLEKAKLRHDARTPEQVADIRERAEIRRIANELGLNPYTHTPEALTCMQNENAYKADTLYEETGVKKGVRLSAPLSITKDKKCYTRDVVEYRTRFGGRIVKPVNLSKSKQHFSVGDAAKAMDALPIELKGTLNEVVLLDYKNPYDIYWESIYKMKNFRSWATGGNGTVAFYYNESWEIPNNPIFNTLCHECGHNMDWKLNKISDSKIWSDAMSKDLEFNKSKSSPTEYGKVHVQEDFADSIKSYIIDKENFRKNFPNRFLVIRAILERLD